MSELAQVQSVKNSNKYDIDPAVWSTLKNSLYTGGKDESIKMVVEYCKAYKLDPLQKPVHIVPMSVKNAETKQYEYRDTIMPGIGLYRIQAARSNKYAGVSEPEYGDTISGTLSGVDISYPEWCKVTVRNIVGDTIVEFTAKEYWLENYATQSSKTDAPNSMWQKRPFGQLAKCTEAQALRKAFPEIISQQPTAEEMEGKTFAENENIKTTKALKNLNITPIAQRNKLLDGFIGEKKVSEEVSNTKNLKKVSEFTGSTYEELQNLIESHNIPKEQIDKWCNKADVTHIEELPEDKKQLCIDYILKNKQIEDYQNLNTVVINES